MASITGPAEEPLRDITEVADKVAKDAQPLGKTAKSSPKK